MRFKIFVFILLLICFLGGDFIGKSLSDNSTIRLKKHWIVLTDTLPQNYCVQKGRPKGYQLELFQLYTKGKELTFELLPVSNVEERLEMLQNGVADIAIFSEGIDSLAVVLANFPDLCPSFPLDNNIQSVWIVSKGNEWLISDINSWVSNWQGTQDYILLQLKYFDHSYTGKRGRISPYDHWFKKYSPQIGWDWRLVAALCCQESNFDPDVQSRRGAFGLMQIMPETAEYIGIDSIEYPENNIRAGIKLIAWLKRQLKSEEIPEEELIKFLLSAYNAGIGRIQDCRGFAQSQGKNPNVWSEVKEIIPLMNKPEYYRSEYIQQGRFNGAETVEFVDEILERYEHYKALVAI